MVGRKLDVADNVIGKNYDDESNELRVSPITLYKSDRKNEFGDLIAVNDSYITYPIRNGLIRIIHKHSVKRVLLREHEKSDIIETTFFKMDSPLLLTACLNKIVVWKLYHNVNEKEIGYNMVYSLETQSRRVIWHTINHEILCIMYSNYCAIVHLNGKMISLAKQNTELNDVVFTKDAKRMIVACENGRVLVYDTSAIHQEVELLQSVLPLGAGESIRSIDFMNEHVLVLGSNGSSKITLWDFMDQGALGLKQTILVENDGQNVYTIKVDDSGQFVFVASRFDTQMYVLHFEMDRFDHVCCFQIANPVLSFMMTATNNADGEREMHAYCIQTMAIQQYHIVESECYEQGDYELNTYDNSEDREIYDADTQQEFNYASAGRMNEDFNRPLMQQSVGAVTTEDKTSMPAPVAGENTACTSDGMNVALTEDGNDASLRVNEGGNDAALNQMLFREMEEKLTATYQQILGSAIQSVLIPAMGRIVLHATENNIMTPMRQMLENTFVDKMNTNMEGQLDKALQEKVPKIIHSALQKATKDVVHDLNTPVKESFRACFEESIIPSFQAATQKMIKQINSNVNKSINTTDPTPIQQQLTSMQGQLSQLTKAVESLSEKINCQPQTLTKSSSKETIDTLLQSADYDSAFQQALAAEDINVVVDTCRRVNSASVMKEDRLPQIVMLCIIQQLGSDFENDVDLKLEWIKNGLLALQVNDTSIVDIVQSTLAELEDNLYMLPSSFHDSNYSIIFHILRSLQT